MKSTSCHLNMFASAKEKRQKVASTASSPLAWLSRVYFSRYPANGEFARRLTVSVSRNSVLIISHITFRDCHVHLFRQPFSKQLYMRRPADSLAEISLRATKIAANGQPAFSYKHNNNFIRKQSMSRPSPVN